MSEARVPVAKARIVLLDGGEELSLMSRKRADGKPKHGQLEMLGGHLEAGEGPLDGLIRELREEERTGTLAACAARQTPPFATKTVDDAVHYLFELRLDDGDVRDLKPNPEESLGFELVPTADLVSVHWDQLTWRTQRLFEAFGPRPVQS